MSHSSRRGKGKHIKQPTLTAWMNRSGSSASSVASTAVTVAAAAVDDGNKWKSLPYPLSSNEATDMEDVIEERTEHIIYSDTQRQHLLGDVKEGNSHPQLLRRHIASHQHPRPPLRTTVDHTVLIDGRTVSPISNMPPLPYPKAPHRDTWSQEGRVLMPYSKHSTMVEEGMEVSRWFIIKRTLSHPLTNSYALANAILRYNPRQVGSWNFMMLHHFFENIASNEESREFFHLILPAMVQCALALPNLVTVGIPLLRAGHEHAVTLSQQQIASLLCNAFFCTYPRRSNVSHRSKFHNYPSINFNKLFNNIHDLASVCAAKFRCLFSYFKAACGSTPLTGCITFKRLVSHHLISAQGWTRAGQRMGDQRIFSMASGKIEDTPGMVQSDFCNKIIGGGVLGRGAVQEEIRFMISPELLVVRLFAEKIEDHEAFIIHGAQRFSNYLGYADTFSFDSRVDDQTASDDWSRRLVSVIAFDALVYRERREQFLESMILRELNKAFIAFSDDGEYSNVELAPAIVTGNWGCGAFGGDKHLKALIQLMAAAATSRQILYLTFGDEQLASDINSIHLFFVEEKVTISEVWNALLNASSTSNDLFNHVRLFVGEIRWAEEMIASNNSIDVTIFPTMQEESRFDFPNQGFMPKSSF